MRIGMLWLDASQRPFPDRLKEAAAYYRQKYGADPNTCVINPKESAQPGSLDGIEVKTSKAILPGHLWLGRGEHGQ